MKERIEKMNKNEIMDAVKRNNGKGIAISYSRENLKNVVELDDEYKVMIDEIYGGYICFHIPNQKEIELIKIIDKALDEHIMTVDEDENIVPFESVKNPFGASENGYMFSGDYNLSDSTLWEV